MSALCKLILVFRLIALNVTIFQLVLVPRQTPAILLALLVAAFASYIPLRRWETVHPIMVRRPTLLAIDLCLTLVIFAVLGPGSPFFLYTLGTALLAGVLYGWAGAVVFSTLLLAGYYSLSSLSGNGFDALAEEGLASFPSLVTLPLLYPIAAAGGAAVRGLLDRQAATETDLHHAQLAAAAGNERSRVAREMHDSLGKTLYGMALSARALSRRVEQEAPGAASVARGLSTAAQVAAAEARELISDLRSDALELPLGEALASHVARWSQESGVEASFDGESVDLPHPGTRYELFSIVKEALRNVEAHAAADSVIVRLRETGGEVVLSVGDDGVGLPDAGESADPRALEPEGHYGFLGMVERAERIGARVAVSSGPGDGTVVTVRVPSGDVRTSEPWELEGAGLS